MALFCVRPGQVRDDLGHRAFSFLSLFSYLTDRAGAYSTSTCASMLATGHLPSARALHVGPQCRREVSLALSRRVFDCAADLLLLFISNCTDAPRLSRPCGRNARLSARAERTLSDITSSSSRVSFAFLLWLRQAVAKLLTRRTLY